MQARELAAASRRFGPFLLMGPEGPLLQDGNEVRLQPKALAVLWLLVRQAGEVVTRDALRDAVWPRMAVGDEALTFQIQALRAALGDSARQPRYIATVHRVGFRFLARVQTEAGAAAIEPADTADLMVGRAAASTQLAAAHGRALRGKRRLFFVCGEAGMGKTMLIDHWQRTLDAETRIARGQCVEQRGAGEAFSPILQALDQLCRDSGGAQIIERIAAVAPWWLGQITSVRARDDKPAGQVTRERVLRELVELIETLAQERPLALILEDLHWADGATIEALDMLARRREPARLMLVCTYRPVDAILNHHAVNALRLELRAQGLCEDCQLEHLGPADVEAFLRWRFADRAAFADLAPLLHRRTEGHPLFMAQVAADLERAPAGGESEHIEKAVPQSLRELIAMQAARSAPQEQELLEAASLAGAEFSAAAVAAALGLPLEQAESLCESLARQRRFVEERGLAIWPDGTVSGRYAFRHALYQAVLSAQAGAISRTRRHALLGARLEAGYGERAGEIAAELALHFRQGRDAARALRYARLAADNALAQAAAALAVPQLEQALELIREPDAPPERSAQELEVQTALGVALMSARGLASPDAVRAFARAQALCVQRGDDARLVPVLWGIFMFHLIRADFDAAGEIAQQLGRLGSARVDVHARLAGGSVKLFRGEFTAAAPEFEKALAWAEQPEGFDAASHAQDLRVDARATAAWLWWILGDAERARRLSAQALEQAYTVVQPNSLAVALFRAAGLHEMLGEHAAARMRAEELLQLAYEHGLAHWTAAAQVMHGAMSALCGAPAQECLAEIDEGIAHRRAMGVGLGMTYDLVLLGRACLALNQTDRGLAAVRTASQLLQSHGERMRDAELLILEGELLRAGDAAAARARFTEAQALAARQGAIAWQRRAQEALARA